MNLQDFHLFLVQWGAWNQAELSKLGYSSPQYNTDYEAGYKPASRIDYPESDFDHASTRLKFVDPLSRAIIKGIYIDDAAGYIKKKYNQDEIDKALRAFLSEYEVEVAA